MAFTSKSNRITLKGYLSTDIVSSPDNDYAIEFTLRVARPHVAGKKSHYDDFTVYISDRQNVNTARSNLQRGMSVSVTGEMRLWFDKTYKVCVSKIQPIW